MRKHTLLLLTLLTAMAMRAGDISFEQISSGRGLSQNTVRAIAVDRNGFVWIGTLDGVNRYDGYHIRAYSLSTESKNPDTPPTATPTDGRIKHLYATADGLVWACTYLGEVSVYDPHTDCFTPITDEQQQPCTFANFLEATDGDVWLWDKKHSGVLRLRREDGTFIKQRYMAVGETCDFLSQDTDGNIWMGGKNGLKRVDPEGQATDYFTYKYHVTQARAVNGYVCFSTMESVLLAYERSTGQFLELPSPFEEGMTDLFRFSTNQVLVLFQQRGLYVCNLTTGRFTRSEINSEVDQFSSDVAAVYDTRGGTWFYSKPGKIWYCDGVSGTVRRFNVMDYRNNFPGRPDNIIYYMENVHVDAKGLYWIASYGYGLFCYDPADGQLTNFTSRSGVEGLTSNYLLSLAEDAFGNIWIGTEYAGVVRLSKGLDYVSQLRIEPGSAVGKNNNVRAIFQDSAGDIWIGLKNGGLYVYDHTLTHGHSVDPWANAYTIAEDDQQRIWVGSKTGGLLLYDRRTRRRLAHLTHDDEDPNSMPDRAVFHILKDHAGRMWVSTFSGGGILLVRETSSGFHFQSFLIGLGNRSLVRYLYEDNQQRMWAATSDGLIRFHTDELIRNPQSYVCYHMEPDEPNAIKGNDIKMVFQDSEGTIWVGTAGGGLNKFVEGTDGQPDRFTAITTAQGLPDNYALGILEHGNYLWVSTEHGLSRIDRQTGHVTNLQLGPNIYSNICNETACLRLDGDTLLWGTLDGLMIFRPSKFHPEANTPPVLITGMSIEGVPYSNTTSPSITYAQQIELRHDQGSFVIEFASLDLTTPRLNLYSYILEGFDGSWSTPSPDNTATYKNLPPGHYTFKVRGANPFGVWNEQLTQLAITINPPFYLRPMAIAVYVLLILLALLIAYRLILKFAKLSNAVEIERQLTSHKLRFFTNVSHEFRTPLTLIQGATDQLIATEGLPPDAYKHIDLLRRNTKQLRALIDELLEFRKLQNDVLTLDLEPTDMVAFARDIYNGFTDIAQHKNIDYQFQAPADNLPIYIDRKKIGKVIGNLLANALKFTPQDGRVTLSVDVDPTAQECVVDVIDTGIGIPKEKRHLLFSRFSHINFSATGTGIGLSMVKEFADAHKAKITHHDNPGGGSIFTLRLSLLKTTYQGQNFPSENSEQRTVNSEHTDHGAISAITAGVDAASPHTCGAHNAEMANAPDQQNGAHPDGQCSLFTIHYSLPQPSLLIIDDNPDMRLFLADTFRTTMQVDTAADGEEGLRKANDQQPDIIIADVMMPTIDGFELTRRLKDDFSTCHIPIILLTAHSTEENQLQSADCGADDFVTKPFDLKYLQTRVWRLLEQRQMLKQRFMNADTHTETKADADFMEKVNKILSDNYPDSTFGIDRFVELSGVRRTVFFKKVKALTGCSPNELIKLKRLNEATRLLRDKQLNVSEVSYNVGFDDPYYFSKCFKAQFGLTPKEYRAEKAEK